MKNPDTSTPLILFSGLATDASVLKWSLARILDRTRTPQRTCVVYHIHGERDFILPMRFTRPDTIVLGGGHVISLAHPSEVNKFILSALAQVIG